MFLAPTRAFFFPRRDRVNSYFEAAKDYAALDCRAGNGQIGGFLGLSAALSSVAGWRKTRVSTVPKISKQTILASISEDWWSTLLFDPQGVDKQTLYL
jgi:hypothetical protein